MTDTDLIRELAAALSEARHQAVDYDGLDVSATGPRHWYRMVEPALTAARSRLAREDAQPAAVSAQEVEAPIEVVRLAAAAQEVHRLGAQCGPQWLRLGTALTLYSVYVAKRAAQPAPEPAEPVATVLNGGDIAHGLVAWTNRAAPPKCGDKLYAAPPSQPVAPAGWRENAVRWLRMLPEQERDAAYWTNGRFAADCADLADAIASTAAPAPVALSEEQIVMDGLMMLPNDDAADCAKAFAAGVRFAERAHGITAPSAAEGGSNVRAERPATARDGD